MCPPNGPTTSRRTGPTSNRRRVGSTHAPAWSNEIRTGSGADFVSGAGAQAHAQARLDRPAGHGIRTGAPFGWRARRPFRSRMLRRASATTPLLGWRRERAPGATPHPLPEGGRSLVAAPDDDEPAGGLLRLRQRQSDSHSSSEWRPPFGWSSLLPVIPADSFRGMLRALPLRRGNRIIDGHLRHENNALWVPLVTPFFAVR